MGSRTCAGTRGVTTIAFLAVYARVNWYRVSIYFILLFTVCCAQLLGSEIRGELRVRVCVCLSVSGCERLIFNGAQTISNQTANLLLFYYCYLFLFSY